MNIKANYYDKAKHFNNNMGKGKAIIEGLKITQNDQIKKNGQKILVNCAKFKFCPRIFRTRIALGPVKKRAE